MAYIVDQQNENVNMYLCVELFAYFENWSQDGTASSTELKCVDQLWKNLALNFKRLISKAKKFGKQRLASTWQTFEGQLSRRPGREVKNLDLSPSSLICISSRKRTMSIRSFLKKPGDLLSFVITS